MTAQITTENTVVAQASALPPKKQISLDEIVESFDSVTQDIVQIGKLATEEKTVFAQFLESLKNHLEPLCRPVEVSTSIVPIDLGVVNQAHIKCTGHLELTFVDGHNDLVDLGEPRNRDLMMAVIDDVMPKFEALIGEIEEENRRRANYKEPLQVEVALPQTPAPVIPQPEIVPVVAVEPPAAELPISLPEPVTPEPEPEPPQIDPTIALMEERNAQIEAITAETLTYLDMLGSEMFEQKPVSKYFDDWMGNLRQVILSFESSEAIGAYEDEAFAAQYNQIFSKIQTELDNRIADEAEIAASYLTLAENRHLLNKIDEEHTAKTKQLVEKGASVIETLMRNAANIERELSEVQAVQVSYRHPMLRMAKDQKAEELTQRLNAVKRRLALAVGYSSTNAGKGDVEAQFVVQTKALEEKRKVVLMLLTKNFDDLANKIAKLKRAKTSNPIHNVAIQQQVYETEQKLFEAKKQLKLAEQNSSYEMARLRDESEKKKQAALGQVQTLEKNIATKAVDNSAGVRKEAAKALAEAVKSLSEKKKAASLSLTKERAPQG